MSRGCCCELLPCPKALAGSQAPSNLTQQSQLQSGESRPSPLCPYAKSQLISQWLLERINVNTANGNFKEKYHPNQ